MASRRNGYIRARPRFRFPSPFRPRPAEGPARNATRTETALPMANRRHVQIRPTWFWEFMRKCGEEIAGGSLSGCRVKPAPDAASRWSIFPSVRNTPTLP